MLGLFRFCLDFSEFGYVTDSMSQTFSKFLDGHTFYLRLFDYTTFMAVFIEKVFLVYSFLVL